MTKKRCTDCKHTKGIGYDFWCGEGHTEYEVFGAETNCPYYEYHDWSKGTPMTEKRFKTNEVGCIVDCYDCNLKNYDGQEIVDLLNDLHEENEQLRKENKFLQCTIESNSQDDYIDFLEKQNEKLKERIEELVSHDKIVFMNG